MMIHLAYAFDFCRTVSLSHELSQKVSQCLLVYVPQLEAVLTAI